MEVRQRPTRYRAFWRTSLTVVKEVVCSFRHVSLARRHGAPPRRPVPAAGLLVSPRVPSADIARATGSAERSVRDWKAAIIAKGYLAVRKRGREGGGRGADEHDLSGLFAALEELALEEELQRGSDQARDRLPAPRYFHGLASVPSLGTRAGRQRPRLETERVRPHESKAAGFRRINAAGNCRNKAAGSGK